MNQLFSSQTLKEALLHTGGALIGYALGYAFSSEATQAISFATVSGWWCALYIGALYRVGLRALLWVAVLFEAFLMVDVVANLHLFYEEGASGSPLAYILLSQIGLVMFVSPIVVNALVARGMRNKVQAHA